MAHLTTLSDASTTMVMDHLSEIEKRRRVTMIRQKEVDTRMAFALAESKAIQTQDSALNAEEAELRRDLDNLIQEQQQVQQQLMVEMDRVRRGEEEELLLQQHTSNQLRAIEAELNGWREKMHDLRSFHQVWEADNTLTSLQEQIRAAAEATQKAREKKNALLAELSDGEAKLTELNELHTRQLSALNKCGSTGLPESAGAGDIFGYSNEDDAFMESTPIFGAVKASVEAAGADALEEVLGSEMTCAAAYDGSTSQTEAARARTQREELEKTLEDAAQGLAQQKRQNATLKREVDDLTGRAEELTRWLTGVTQDREHVDQKVEQLRQCIERQLCVTCLASSDDATGGTK